MAGKFQPPPTYAAVELDESGNFYFSPIWLQWFTDLTAALGTDGTPSAVVTDGILVNSVFAPKPVVAEITLIAGTEQQVLVNQVFGP